MSDFVQTILNSNPVRQGTTVVLADKFGNTAKLNSNMPSGNPATLETRYTNRLGERPAIVVVQEIVTVASSGAEASWAIPEGIEKYLFKCRTQDDITYGFNSGSASGVNRTTLFGGTAFESPSEFRSIAGQTLYFTGASGLVVEINYWR